MAKRKKDSKLKSVASDIIHDTKAPEKPKIEIASDSGETAQDMADIVSVNEDDEPEEVEVIGIGKAEALQRIGYINVGATKCGVTEGGLTIKKYKMRRELK